MKLAIELNLDNSAFGDDFLGEEISYVLGRLSARIPESQEAAKEFDCLLRDSNGNECGYAKITG